MAYLELRRVRIIFAVCLALGLAVTIWLLLDARYGLAAAALLTVPLVFLGIVTGVEKINRRRAR